jgi:hypothetical protein
VGIVTTSSERTFTRPAEFLFDFVSNPANWTRTYPGGPQIRNLAAQLPLKVGDTWDEAHPDPEKVGLLGHDSAGNGGLDGRMTIEYHFTQPDDGVTLFTRTMTIEAFKDTPLSDGFFRMVNPAHIDAYLAAIARELED